MQTFLSSPFFTECAVSLDKRRCWKQVVEAKQMLCNLRTENLPIEWQNSKDYINQKYKNHPAVKMWKDYDDLLKHYYNIFLKYCLDFHKINTKLEYITCAYSYPAFTNHNILMIWEDGLDDNGNLIEQPFWLGNEDFHRAMRARLIEKDRNFYLKKFPEDEGFNNGKYWWPEMETKTFRII